MLKASEGVLFILWCCNWVELVSGDCANVPTIENTFNNASQGPYVQGYVLSYTCNPGYYGNGTSIYTCVNNAWVGSFHCLRKCPPFQNPQNGKIVGKPTYKVGSRINFACNEGYDLEGDASLLCRASGEWRPSKAPTCKTKDCGSFGTVANGQLFQANPDGVYNNYLSVIEVTCDEGFILDGTTSVTCNADGNWGPKPECKSSSCGSHPAGTSKCIYDSNLIDGTYSILCMDNSQNVSVTEIGSGTAFCENNQWDNINMGCFCDCLVDENAAGVLYINLNGMRFVKHGKGLMWSCKDGYKTNKSNNTLNCIDGVMEKPQCIPIHTRGDGEESNPNLGTILVILLICAVVIALVTVGIVKRDSIKAWFAGGNPGNDKNRNDDNAAEELPLDTTGS